MRMREITLAEKKRLLLDMLSEIHEFCEKNAITYFLVGGTLLGAVRHDGFIPWDDDIDIGMPREDYTKFISTFQSKYADVWNWTNKDNYVWPAAKVINKETVLIENGNKKNAIGVFIDVFPFDKVSGNYVEAVSKQKRIAVWKNAIELKYLAFDKKRPLHKNIIVGLGKMLFLVPDSFVLKNIERLSIKDNCKKCEYICNFAGAWGKREIAQSNWFQFTIKHVFEGRYFNIPAGYHEYLSTVYGNYMELPPVEKRVTHHGNVAYWKEK